MTLPADASITGAAPAAATAAPAAATAAPATAPLSDADLDAYMELAIAEARHCTSVASAFNVGAVVVRDRQVLATGYSRELPGNTHAEECCLIKLQDPQTGVPAALDRAVLFTTMEPCGERLSGKVPCAHRLIAAGIRTVYVGVREPPHLVANTSGHRQLLNANIAVVYLPQHEAACQRLNEHFESPTPMFGAMSMPHPHVPPVTAPRADL